MNQFLIVNGRVNVNGQPVKVHLEMHPLRGAYSDAGEDGTSPEAGSLACFNALFEVLERFGIKMISSGPGSERKDVSIFEVTNFPAQGFGIAEQVRVGAADGEACFNGSGRDNVKALFKDPDRGYGDSTHVVHHDPPHATDLLKKDSNQAVPDDYVELVLKPTVKAIYSHYSQSPKRFRNLTRLCVKLGIKWEQLHYIFDIRFIASEELVYSHFLNDLAAIVLHLKQEKEDDEISSEVKVRITGFIRILTQFKFVSMLITQLDINGPLSKFSKQMQNDTTLWIFYPDFHADLKFEISRLKIGLGPNGVRLLPQLSAGELHSIVDAREAPSMDEGDELPVSVSRREDGKFVVKMKLSAAPNGTSATRARLLSHQVLL